MISLPPPDSAPRSQLPEPQAAEDAVEALDAVEAEDAVEALDADAADQAEDAGAPDSSEAPDAQEATSADSSEASEPQPRKRRNAFSSLEIAAQIAQVQEWLTMGKRPNQIRQLCSDEWGLNTRVAESRMHEARKQMVVDVDVYVRKDKAAQMVQQLEQVLEQALQMRQGSNAIGALRLQADLLQLLSRHQ